MARYMNFAMKLGLRKARSNRVIVLEDLDFLWDRSELNEFIEIWNKGYNILYAAEYFERDPDEVLLAIMHLARAGKIERREGGLLGC